jgi:hypothetical protein
VLVVVASSQFRCFLDSAPPQLSNDFQDDPKLNIENRFHSSRKSTADKDICHFRKDCAEEALQPQDPWLERPSFAFHENATPGDAPIHKRDYAH